MKHLQLSQFSDYLKPRHRDMNKSDAGRVLVVGGNVGYSGAVRLAAEAALRVGAGLVSVATRKEHAFVLNATRPEIMCHAVESDKELELLMKNMDVIIVGPGLGQDDWSRALLKKVFASEKKCVVDADALNLLAVNPEKKVNWILTPHPGEAGRLLTISAADIQKDRVAAIKKIQSSFGGVCVLKGAGSLVLDESGEPVLCEAGNPGMATAGMGDVLSGVIGGLVAQGIPLNNAAKLGVLLHALAGDRAAKQGERGMIASDLFVYLRELVNNF